MAIKTPALLLALCLTTGCATSAGSQDPTGWLEARGADLMDVVGVRVAIGAGLGAYVRATQWVQLGYMNRGPAERDLPAPEGVQRRAMPCVALGTIGRYGGVWFENSLEVMLPGWSSRSDGERLIEREPIVGYVSRDGSQDDWKHALGVGLHALLVGAEVELRPVELVDFVAGLFGYDPSGDDVPVEASGEPAGPES